MLGKLNETESAVLEQLRVSSEGNGHDFGFTDEVTVVQPNLVGGYVSQLVQKGYINVYSIDVNENTIDGCFEFTPEAKVELLGYELVQDGLCVYAVAQKAF